MQGGGHRLRVLTDVSGVTSAAHAVGADASDGGNNGCLFAILGPSGTSQAPAQHRHAMLASPMVV